MKKTPDEDFDSHNVIQEDERRKITNNAKEANQHETPQRKEEKQVKSLEEEVRNNYQNPSKRMYINACNQGINKSWFENILGNGPIVKLKLDSGSDCSVLLYNILKKY